MAALDEIGNSKYISLTTYRKDGSGVATPVWHVRDGDRLIIISRADAGKVKRLRRDARVTVVVCDVRGRVAPGATVVRGEGIVLDDAGTQAGRRLLERKYLSSRLGNWLIRTLRLRRPPVVAIAVRLTD